MVRLKHLLTEQTDATKFCKTDILSKPQFSKEKWSAIGVWSPKGGRNVAGTDIPSEHNIGNAIDWHGAKGIGDPVMQELADYLVANHSVYSAKNVIYNRRIWNSPKGWHAYKGENPHTNHVHIDFITGAKPKPKPDPNKTYREHNLKILNVIERVYKVVTSDPEDYFSKFSSWNPFAPGIGDDEEGAYYWFTNWFADIKRDILDPIKKSTNTENKKTISNLESLVDDIASAIWDGDSLTQTLQYYYYSDKQKKFISTSLTFTWDYL